MAKNAARCPAGRSATTRTRIERRMSAPRRAPSASASPGGRARREMENGLRARDDLGRHAREGARGARRTASPSFLTPRRVARRHRPVLDDFLNAPSPAAQRDAFSARPYGFAEPPSPDGLVLSRGRACRGVVPPVALAAGRAGGGVARAARRRISAKSPRRLELAQRDVAEGAPKSASPRPGASPAPPARTARAWRHVRWSTRAAAPPLRKRCARARAASCAASRARHRARRRLHDPRARRMPLAARRAREVARRRPLGDRLAPLEPLRRLLLGLVVARARRAGLREVVGRNMKPLNDVAGGAAVGDAARGDARLDVRWRNNNRAAATRPSGLPRAAAVGERARRSGRGG